MPSKPGIKSRWLSDKRFYWVDADVDDDSRAKCNLCGATMTALEYVLIRHMNNCSQHKKNDKELMSIVKSQSIEETNDMLRLATLINFQNIEIARIEQNEQDKFVYYEANTMNS